MIKYSHIIIIYLNYMKTGRRLVIVNILPAVLPSFKNMSLVLIKCLSLGLKCLDRASPKSFSLSPISGPLYATNTSSCAFSSDMHPKGCYADYIYTSLIQLQIQHSVLYSLIECMHDDLYIFSCRAKK